jgi:hypothetical protein
LGHSGVRGLRLLGAVSGDGLLMTKES